MAVVATHHHITCALAGRGLSRIFLSALLESGPGYGRTTSLDLQVGEALFLKLGDANDARGYQRHGLVQLILR